MKNITNDTKQCSGCGKVKSIKEFVYVKGKVTGVCKECNRKNASEYYRKNKEQINQNRKGRMKAYRQKRKRTIGGWYTKTYNRIKHDNMVKFNLELPFTKEEFINWIDNNYHENFKELFDNYINSNCDKMLNPSIDRIDDYKSYVFDNMQLITWKENYIKSLHSEKSTFRGKSVAKFDEQNNEVARYNSISEAERATGIEQRVISYCCKTNSTLNHFYWRYVENKTKNNKIRVLNSPTKVC